MHEKEKEEKEEEEKEEEEEEEEEEKEEEEEEGRHLRVAVELCAYVHGGDKHGAVVAAQAASPVDNLISVETRTAAIGIAARW